MQECAVPGPSCHVVTLGLPVNFSLVQDLREFNASVGECICESPKDCGREAMV